LLRIVPAVAEKRPVFKPKPTLTLAGTERALLSLLRVTVRFGGADLFRVMVQLDDVPEVRLVGRHEIPLTCGGAMTLRLNSFDRPPALAVRLTVWSVEGEDTVAVKSALLCPAETVTLEGTLTLALLLESPTATLVGADPVSVTVQDEDPGAFTLDGEQASELNATETGWFTVMTPPVPDALIEPPAEVAATTPPI
jgi:hypothetical protein